MVSDFCNKILKAGNHLVYDFPSSIFKQDISYTVKNGELDIFIHCPIVSMSSIPAFQYLGLPGILHETNKGPVLFIESRERYDLLMIDTQTQSFLSGCQTARSGTFSFATTMSLS